jgi:hypothetical protein
MTEIESEAVREWVEASCAAQGVPLKVADTTVLSAVAELLGVRQVVRRSDAPDRGEAGRVELVEAAPAGSDDDVIEHGRDDRMLP